MEAVMDRLEEIEVEKYNMAARMDKFIVAKNMKTLDFTNKDRQGYVEYEDGLYVKNITSRVQELLGVTMLRMFTTKDTEMQTHQHKLQAQMITVNKGKVFDDETDKLYTTGDSIFITKQINHTIKYFADSEYVVYFAPNLIPL